MLPAIVIVSTLVVVIALIAGLLIWRGQRIEQLLIDGVNAEGTVTRQWWHNPRGPSAIRHYLRYRYCDSAGNEHHARRIRVTQDYWTTHPPGVSIAVTYSASRPHISAPRHLVDLARQAKSRQS